VQSHGKRGRFAWTVKASTGVGFSMRLRVQDAHRRALITPVRRPRGTNRPVQPTFTFPPAFGGPLPSSTRPVLSRVVSVGFMFVAAMNPCRCGHLGDTRRECACTPRSIEKYRARISGPLLDRIDLHAEGPALSFT